MNDSSSAKDAYSNQMHLNEKKGGQVPPAFCKNDIDFKNTSIKKFAEYVAAKNTTQKTSEINQLVEFLFKYGQEKLKVILEIGTYKGGTLWMFSQVALDDACIISIDLPGGNFGGGC